MAALQNQPNYHQRRSKSSHPAGSEPRDKSKYNKNGRNGDSNDGSYQNRNQDNGEKAVVSQEELTEFLTAKLKDNRFVIVTVKKTFNEHGTLFEIDVRNGGLFRVGNGAFFSMKLHTVSHKSRVIFITIVFNRDTINEERIRINSDSIIQIFRELAPNTIDKISIQHLGENKPLAVVASTIKGASLNYTYERALEFIHLVDEKYCDGAAAASASGDDTTAPEDLSADQIDVEEAILEKKLKALKELKASKNADSGAAPGEDEDTTATPAPRPKKPTKVSVTIGNKTRIVIPRK